MNAFYRLSLSIFCLTFIYAFSYAGSGGEEENDVQAGSETDKTGELQIRLKFINDELRVPEFNSVDKEMKFLLARWNLKGAVVAVAKNGKLVYTRGYGYADARSRIKTQPEHLFRIASVSKLITSAAIFKLIEENKLNLNDPVFGEKGLLNDSIYLAQIGDQRIMTITVERLLRHSAGWSRKKWGDPLFFPINFFNQFGLDSVSLRKKVIAYTLRRELDFNPGENTVYSNIGYVILGEIIEKVTGMPYYMYVKKNLFNPLYIEDILPGASLREDKYADEVCYYDAPGRKAARCILGLDKLTPRPYGGANIELLEASGGWVASAPDLLKFVLAIDGYDDAPDLLSKESIEAMTSVTGGGLPMGWIGVSDYSWWRTGTLAGSSSLVIRRSDSVSYVVITNTSARPGNRFPAELYNAMERALKEVKEWPDHDLYRRRNLIISKPLITARKPELPTSLYDQFEFAHAEVAALTLKQK